MKLSFSYYLISLQVFMFIELHNVLILASNSIVELNTSYENQVVLPKN